MPNNEIETVEVASRQAWRAWLADNYDTISEIWLIFYKRHTGITTMSYHDAIEEAICFGWIDSLIKRLDDDRYARKFTPRKADSKWSDANRKRFADLERQGLLAAPGLARPPTDRRYNSPAVSAAEVPAYIEERFQENPTAWAYFQELAPSHRRRYIAWVDSAKRPETKERRLGEALELLAARQKLGMK